MAKDIKRKRELISGLHESRPGAPYVYWTSLCADLPDGYHGEESWVPLLLLGAWRPEARA